MKIERIAALSLTKREAIACVSPFIDLAASGDF